MAYVHPEALVSTDWLAGHLDDPRVRVVDATWFGPGAGDALKEFGAAHIPGAVHVDIDDVCDRETPIVHQLPPAEQFARQIGAKGIGNGHRVIVYDRSTYYCAAARVWWMFRVFGHDDVALLDGGFAKWQAERRPVAAGNAHPTAATFGARYRPELVRTVDQMIGNLRSRREQVIDSRNADAYAGREPETWPGIKKQGHIPGAVHLHGVRLVDGAKGHTIRPAAELDRIFREGGVDPAKPLCVSCGSGVIAGLTAFGLYLLGQETVPVFDGSWAEWGSREDTPVETGGA